MLESADHIKIETPFIRLGALLKFAGMTETGGDAKQLIQEGMIKVNGEVCTIWGKKIYPGDRVEMPGGAIVVE